ncbi:MAG: anti-sigma factor antagonist [Firmicutes bacterium]|nr:anti-sigma factor antagonist [Bacillota bacterium]
MGIRIDIHDRTLIAAPEGELDHLQAERLRAQIDAAYDKSPCKHIIIDMAKVSFMDSSGIGMIIGRYKNAETRGGRLALANMSDPMCRLFEISGLSKIVLRTSSVNDALTKLGGSQSE